MEESSRFKRLFAVLALSVVSVISLGSVQSAESLDMLGVVDRANHFLIPPKYENIQYLGQGIFVCYPVFYERKPRVAPFAKEHQQRHQRAASLVRIAQSVELRNRDGHLITALPPGSFVDKLLPVNVAGVDQAGANSTSLLLVEFRRESGTGVIDGAGQILLQPEYDSVELDDDCRLIGYKKTAADSKPKSTICSTHLQGFASSTSLRNPEIPTVFSEGLGVFRANSKLAQDQISSSNSYGRDGRVENTQPTLNPRPWVFGYMDPAHKIIIPAKYYQAADFKKG